MDIVGCSTIASTGVRLSCSARGREAAAPGARHVARRHAVLTHPPYPIAPVGS